MTAAYDQTEMLNVSGQCDNTSSLHFLSVKPFANFSQFPQLSTSHFYLVGDRSNSTTGVFDRYA